MRTSLRLAALLSLMLACKTGPRAAPAATDPSTSGLSADDQAAIHAVDSGWAAALNRGDAAAMAAFYASDAVVQAPDAPPVSGAGDVRKLMESLASMKPTDVTVTPQHVEGRGDLAFVTGTFTMMAGGKPLKGHYAEVLKKQGDGSWQYRVDAFGFDAKGE